MKLGSRYYISVHKTAYTNDSCDIDGRLRFSLQRKEDVRQMTSHGRTQ